MLGCNLWLVVSTFVHPYLMYCYHLHLLLVDKKTVYFINISSLNTCLRSSIASNLSIPALWLSYWNYEKMFIDSLFSKISVKGLSKVIQKSAFHCPTHRITSFKSKNVYLVLTVSITPRGTPFSPSHVMLFFLRTS